MENEQETTYTLRRLNRNAILLGALSMFIAIFIGVYAYTTSRNILLQSICNSNLELTLLLGQYAENAIPTSQHNSFILKLDEAWKEIEKQYPDSYICLVNKSGKLLVHTAHPQTVGNDVGDNRIQKMAPNGASNLRELLSTRQNWVGHYTSSAGQKQIAAFAYLPNRENLLGFHVPLKDVETQLGAIATPWLIGVGGIVFVLIPLAIGFLYRASVTSQQQLAQANLNLTREIYERQRAEEKMEDAHTLLEQTFASLEDAVLVLDTSRVILNCNASTERIFGYTKEELIGKETDFLHVSIESFEKFGDTITQALGDQDFITFEYQMKRKDGTVFPTEHTIKKFLSDIDSKNYTVSVVHDITERKKMQEALVEGEARFSQLAEHIHEVFWMSDVNKNQMLYVSPGYERIWGRTCDNLYESPQTWMESIHPDDRERIRNAALIKQAQGTYDEEYRIIRPDGTERLIHDRAFPIKNDLGQVYRIAGLAEDITDRRNLEREQIRIQRINALGELSAGISHNLNNILSGIMGPAQLLKLSTKDPLMLQDIETILTSSMRARDLVHRLHSSTRGLDDETLKPIHLNKIINDAIKGTQPRWKDEAEAKGIYISVETTLEPTLPIQSTESTSYDMLVNLIFNAVDAMPQGGTITIETHQCDGHVLLKFSDTGIGMDEDTQNRIFEPFFTTKVDVGTGLGLCTVYNSVTKWGGHIEVESEVGVGTTFTFQIPNATSESNPSESPVSPEQKRPGKVLVIEDNPEIRQFLERFVTSYHEVAFYDNGPKAISDFESGHYDVALIDLGLAEMPGDQVAQHLHKQDPILSTVLITGWELAPDDPRLSSFDFKLQKPFDNLMTILDLLNQAIVLHDTRKKENHTGE